MSSGIYNRFKQDVLTKKVDLSGDTIMTALMGAGHSYSAAHNVFSDVSANEIPASGFVGYIQGGATVNGLSVAGSSTVKWNAADVSWADSTIIAYHAVLYDANNSNSLICSLDFGGPKSTEAEVFKIRWDNVTNAIITLT